MSINYSLICDKHEVYVDIYSIGFSRGSYLEDPAIVCAFIMRHSDCRIECVSEHDERMETFSEVEK